VAAHVAQRPIPLRLRPEAHKAVALGPRRQRVRDDLAAQRSDWRQVLTFMLTSVPHAQQPVPHGKPSQYCSDIYLAACSCVKEESHLGAADRGEVLPEVLLQDVVCHIRREVAHKH